MTIDDLRAYLTSAGVEFEEKRLQWGDQIRCSSGENFILYDSGKLVPGGPKSELTERVVGLHVKGPRLPGPGPLRLTRQSFQNLAKTSLLFTEETLRQGTDWSLS